MIPGVPSRLGQPLERARSLLAQPRGRRGLLVALGTLGLSALPMVGTLGYFGSLVLAPVFSGLGIAVGVDAHRERQACGLTPLSHLVASAKSAGRELAILVATALAVLGLAQLWQPTCDPWGGLAFFAVGPAASALCGCTVGFLAQALTSGRTKALLLGWAVVLGSTFLGLARLYTHPVVFAYDPFWGYYSGSIYDEDIGISSTYLTYRAYNALAIAVALGAFLLGARRDATTLWQRLRHHLLPSLGLAGAAALVSTIAFSPEQHRFSATAQSLEQVLRRTVRTEHFVLHFAPRTATDRMIDAVAREHEFAWHLLETQLGTAPLRPVHSFIFTSPEQKRQLMGAGRVQVAAPWRNEIYLNEEPYPHQTVHHELAHVFLAAFGDPIFGVSLRGLRLNLALVEGMATALAPSPRDHLDLHDLAAILDRLEKRPELARIMGPGFYGQASRHAYIAAGSFCAWLIEQRGIERATVLYRSAGDFEQAYDESLEQLEAKWLEALRSRPIRPEDLQGQAQLFDVRSVFRRPCAHLAAELRHVAGRAQSSGDEEAALSALRELCAIEPDDPSHRLELADALAELSRFEEARDVLRATLDAPHLHATSRAIIAEREGDMALHDRDWGGARTAFDLALSLPVGESKRRTLAVKRLATLEPDLAPFVLDYFVPFDRLVDGPTLNLRQLHIAHALAATPRFSRLGAYLVARQLANTESPAYARDAYAQSLEADPTGVALPLPTPELVRAARLGLIAESAKRMDLRVVDQTLTVLEAGPRDGAGHDLTVRLWRKRLAFLERLAAGDVRAPHPPHDPHP